MSQPYYNRQKQKRKKQKLLLTRLKIHACHITSMRLHVCVCMSFDGRSQSIRPLSLFGAQNRRFRLKTFAESVILCVFFLRSLCWLFVRMWHKLGFVFFSSSSSFFYRLSSIIAGHEAACECVCVFFLIVIKINCSLFGCAKGGGVALRRQESSRIISTTSAYNVHLLRRFCS